ncbi:class I SAM-dependent methyltransferase [Mycobacterium sp. 21AC1]|uniref:class I SAM-dependent methyltransferase n=1 Tax=[Mycobacterium] appelbergii TaxID=2939269 RepID=UPI0029392E0A|nr:class I SAM-dependent methyltransferase [Mycobacterium sp. 21AC1]MDV3127047.1 class I SAM-dependent methyltransferase [Mycobacterium sp. 21AC1]
MNAVIADRELEAKHRALWALGDYSAIAAHIVAPLGSILVDACGIGPADRVLDVAAGTGNVAIPAAATGARVTASDLCPELVEQGRRLAAERGVTLDWEEANAEALPFGDNEFDVVVSCIGVMFAPHHQQSADELVRVTRPGGRIGLISWTPEGFIGRLFATMKPYVPAPPPGVSPPPLWGDEEHLCSLLADRVGDVVARRRTLAVDMFDDGAAFRDYFKANYGPTISAYRAIEGDADRVAALDADIAALGDRYLTGSSMEWEYLLTVARKR